MHHTKKLKRSGMYTLLAITLGACSWLSGNSLPAQSEQSSTLSWVNIENAGLLASRSGEAELGLTLTNTAKQTLWVNVHFKTPGELTDCTIAKELETQATHFYSCPQVSVQADTVYPIEITIFIDLEHTYPVDRLNTNLSFSPADIQALRQAFKP